MNREQEGRRLTTVEVSFRIIEALQELDGAGVSELADHLDMAPSTVHGHLATLEANQYLVKEGDIYHLGLMFLNKGEYARRRKKAYRLAINKVDELAEETSEKAQFIVEDHGKGVYLHSALGSRAVHIDTQIRIGSRHHLHVSSAGKAILANLPEATVDPIITNDPLPRFTEKTITDPDALWEELKEIRERGYSYAKGEFLGGLRAVGVPVIGRDGTVIGGLSVSGPAERLKGDLLEIELPELLLGAANELELNIAYS